MITLVHAAETQAIIVQGVSKKNNEACQSSRDNVRTVLPCAKYQRPVARVTAFLPHNTPEPLAHPISIPLPSTHPSLACRR